MIRGDHVFHHLFVFQQPHPRRQAFLLRQSLVGILRRPRSHQFPRIFRHIHPGVERLGAHFVAILRAQKSGGDFPHPAIAVRITVPISQHHVMLGAQVVIPPVFGKQQPVQKQRIGEIASAAGLFAEQRPPGARQRALLHLAQGFKDFLPGFAQDDFLAHLERRQPLAVLMRLLLPHVVVGLQQHAAALQHLQKLLVHFRAQKLRDRQPRQQVDRELEFFLGPIERARPATRSAPTSNPRDRSSAALAFPPGSASTTALASTRGASADNKPSNSPCRAISRAICARPNSTNRGLSTTSCRRLSTPTDSPSSETKGVDAARFGGAGFSGAPPSRKIGILGIPGSGIFGSC